MRSFAIVSAGFCAARSSRNCLLTLNDLPPIVACRSFEIRRATWAGSNGAPMVATARASGIFAAAASTAAPPRLCPARICGAMRFPRSQPAAATRSSMFEENSRLEKSKRSVAMPRPASERLT